MKWILILFVILIFTSILVDCEGQNASKDFLKKLTRTETSPALHNLPGFITQNPLYCQICKIFASLLRKFPERPLIYIAEAFLIQECPKIEKETKSVCSGAIHEMGKYLIENMSSHYLSDAFICGEFLNVCPASYSFLDVRQYVQDMTKDTLPTVWPTPTQKKTYKILHVSDTHVDLNYTQGMNAKCDEPLCCRPENGLPINPADGAGEWGNVDGCDLPLKTFKAFTKFVKREFGSQIEYVLWTGDFKAHNVWEDNQQQSITTTQICTQILKEEFQNITVYPVIGNHEAHPVNVFNYFNRSNDDWLINPLSQFWTSWIGEDAARQFLDWGYYSSMVEDRNLKIIGLHQQACNNMNWYLLRDPTDPGRMISWLEKELAESEQKNHTVYLIGHIPGGSCLNEWGKRYSALIERYSNMIRGQFFGHIHGDLFFVTRSQKTFQKTNSPTGIVFVPGSLTTYSGKFPTFRIYEVDSETNIPVNYQNYYLNITKVNSIANLTIDQIDFELEYDFLDAYGYEDMSLQTFSSFAEALRTDQETLEKYTLYRDRMTPESIQEAAQVTLANDGKYNYCNTYDIDDEQNTCLGVKDTGLDLFFEIFSGPWRVPIDYGLTESNTSATATKQ